MSIAKQDWQNIKVWGVASFIIGVIALLLVSFIHDRAIGGTLSIILLTLLIYIVLYHGVMYLLVHKDSVNSEKCLQCFAASFMAESLSFEDRWLNGLQEAFQPTDLSIRNEVLLQPRLAQQGKQLWIPDLASEQTYVLTGKGAGQQCFKQADLLSVQVFYQMAQLAAQASQAQQESAFQERQRIMLDLHDTLGSELLTMTKHAASPQEAYRARRALQTLRDTVHISLSDTPHLLEEYLIKWRSDVVNRCELAEIELIWFVQGDIADVELSVEQAVSLTNILREAVSNAMKHADPKEITVKISYDSEQLGLQIKNDIPSKREGINSGGIGLFGMESRIRVLKGSFNYGFKMIGQDLYWVLDVVIALKSSSSNVS